MSEDVNERPCGPNDYPSGKDYSGPCRETAASRLQRALDDAKRRVAGLERLLKIADHLEPGSPGEELLWELVSRHSFSV